MPSDPLQHGRNSKSGFTLLETLLSLAIAAVFLAVILAMLPGQNLRTRERLDKLIATDFAFSLIEEYRVVGSIHPRLASDAGWAWGIDERIVEPGPQEALNEVVQYLEVTARAWRIDQPEVLAEVTSLIARNKP